MKRAIVAAAIAAGITIGTAGPAIGDPAPTPPYGLTGACNMTNPNAAFGMFTVAGSVANPHGFDEGMITAILNTNGGTIPENCGG
jgi:hypothetical protein